MSLMKLINININKYFHMIPLWKSPIKLPVELPMELPVVPLWHVHPQTHKQPATFFKHQNNQKINENTGFPRVPCGPVKPCGALCCALLCSPTGRSTGSPTGSLIGDFHKGIMWKYLFIFILINSINL